MEGITDGPDTMGTMGIMIGIMAGIHTMGAMAGGILTTILGLTILGVGRERSIFIRMTSILTAMIQGITTMVVRFITLDEFIVEPVMSDDMI
jgi:hypothetical protein